MRFAQWIALFFIVSMPVSAAPEGPKEVVQTATEDLLGRIDADPVLRSNPADVRILVEMVVVPHVDFEGTARLTLSKHWRQASESQKLRFTNAFREFLINTYSVSLSGYAGQTVEFTGTRISQDGDRARVGTRIEQSSGPAVSIDYLLRRNADAWKIYDITVEGISLALSHRGSFSRRIRAQGLDGLIASLEARGNAGVTP